MACFHTSFLEIVLLQVTTFVRVWYFTVCQAYTRTLLHMSGLQVYDLTLCYGHLETDAWPYVR